jgi:hypothetical protein
MISPPMMMMNMTMNKETEEARTEEQKKRSHPLSEQRV